VYDEELFVGFSFSCPQNSSTMKIFFALLFFLASLSQLSIVAEKESSEEEISDKRQSFTLAVLPDTQFYCDTRLKLSKKWGNGDLRHYFFEQTRWVRDNQKRLNIAFLVHEGDIVQAMLPRSGPSQRKPCPYWMAMCPTAYVWETTIWVSKSRTTSTAGISP
jgi:hypothetical protein